MADEEKYVDKAADPDVNMDEPVVKPPDYATKEDFAKLQGMVEGLSASFKNFGSSTPAPAPQPRGPSTDEQIVEIDKQLEKLYGDLDDAISQGSGASKVQRAISKLENYKVDLKYNDKIQELQTFGMYTIDKLTDKVVAKEMPMLKYPEVQKTYEEAISSMSPGQSANPDVRMSAYQYACGKNQTLIFDRMFEEKMRETEKEEQTQTPTQVSGRTQDDTHDPNRIPDPKEYLSKDNLQAIAAAGKTVDSYYRSIGYTGWDDYWVKTGKAYFVGEEEE